MNITPQIQRVSAVAADRAPEIHTALEQLFKTVEESQAVDQLIRQRLQPVLRQEPASPSPDANKAPCPFSSQLANQLFDIRVKLQNQIDAKNHLNGLMEV
jgi:hypothetical protein